MLHSLTPPCISQVINKILYRWKLAMKILFYDDSDVFGGHEKTLIDAVEYLINQTTLNLDFIFYEGNTRFSKYLTFIAEKDKQRVTLYPINYHSSSLQGIKTLFSYKKINFIQTIINTSSPDIIVVVQGTIEISSLGLVAANKSSYKTVSFIPLAFKMGNIGIKIGNLRDVINQYFYGLPNSFITISHNMKKELMQHKVPEEKINVVYCGINANLYKYQDKENSRTTYTIQKDEYVIAVIGQIRFEQKGQDFLIETLSKYITKLTKFKVLIVGDGVDLRALQTIVDNQGLTDMVTFIPWLSDLSYIYSAIDMLVIPSNYEGLPLVMLEAMYYGLPIIASSRDGMQEVLPDDWLFKCGDSESMITTLLRVKNMDNMEFINKNKNAIDTLFNVNIFGQTFLEKIMKLP
jgi:glycosyltransferase involved in cell wall biosynthesis